MESNGNDGKADSKKYIELAYQTGKTYKESKKNAEVHSQTLIELTKSNMKVFDKLHALKLKACSIAEAIAFILKIFKNLHADFANNSEEINRTELEMSKVQDSIGDTMRKLHTIKEGTNVIATMYPFSYEKHNEINFFGPLISAICGFIDINTAREEIDKVFDTLDLSKLTPEDLYKMQLLKPERSDKLIKNNVIKRKDVRPVYDSQRMCYKIVEKEIKPREDKIRAREDTTEGSNKKRKVDEDEE